ncbi:MAG: GDSL-type esterase/lipase family protein [Verrucomicrobiota bacterium]|nr:GDSL-type esterase/lipase family protein [Verrucomicrobiota bacterium]
MLGSILTAVFLAALVDWFSASTQRLYVDEDSAAGEQQGTVWQHFGVRGNEVVPEIISGDEARFTFPISLSARHSLSFTALPEGSAEYEIVLRSGGTDRQIATGKIDRPSSQRISLPAGAGELRFAVHGRIAWFDLRLTRQFHWPLYLAPVVLILFALARQESPRLSRRTGNWLAFSLSTFLCLALIEVVLRARPLKLPLPILTARHELGLSAPDRRWIDSPRYKQRLRPDLRTYCEWDHGDIVRMGFLPPNLFGGEHHRYPFETDAEGFRNPAVRERIEVAALGDSFVDAMTSPREESWPARLEQITGQAVQNYGTSSFGPQQELYALQDYAIRHQPREVVLGYFAGNDLFDAERFDRWEHGGDKPGEEATGWRLKKKYRRYETLYLFTIARVALPAASRVQDSSAAFPMATAPGFDRGAYEIPTESGTSLRFAFMPPYLQKLASARTEIERSRGWELARGALMKMHETCAEHGSRLTVMFIPSKDEVYWPLVERSLGHEELRRSIDFISTYNHMPLQTGDIRANRLAQNELMREFCGTAGISFLDLTPALEQAAASGRAVYFADDAHWNAAGHEIAAQQLARFLARQP